MSSGSKFLRQIERETPADKYLHLICRQLRHPQASDGAEVARKTPRIHMHFTPTSASWLNMVERFFRDITVERLRRGVFHQRAGVGHRDRGLRRASQHQSQAIHLDQEHSRYLAKGHSCK